MKDRMDILLLSANSEVSLSKEDDWQGFVQTIKNYIQG
jgi:hypothetical protein